MFWLVLLLLLLLLLIIIIIIIIIIPLNILTYSYYSYLYVITLNNCSSLLKVLVPIIFICPVVMFQRFFSRLFSQNRTVTYYLVSFNKIFG